MCLKSKNKQTNKQTNKKDLKIDQVVTDFGKLCHRITPPFYYILKPQTIHKACTSRWGSVSKSSDWPTCQSNVHAPATASLRTCQGQKTTGVGQHEKQNTQHTELRTMCAAVWLVSSPMLSKQRESGPQGGRGGLERQRTRFKSYEAWKFTRAPSAWLTCTELNLHLLPLADSSNPSVHEHAMMTWLLRESSHNLV